jgi:hypothetical protein
MPDVEFSDEDSLPTMRTAGAKGRTPPGLMGLVVKAGLARDAKGASFVLLMSALIVSVVAVGVFVSGLP